MIDEETRAEVPAALWEAALNCDRLEINVYEPTTGHPKAIHDRLGGTAVHRFREEFVRYLSTISGGGKVFRITANAFACVTPNNESRKQFQFIFETVPIEIDVRKFSIAEET